jgi:hypothetical protein
MILDYMSLLVPLSFHDISLLYMLTSSPVDEFPTCDENVIFSGREY